MKYYRKVQVDAIQFNQDNKQEVEDFLDLHKIRYKYLGGMIVVYPSDSSPEHYWCVCNTDYIVTIGKHLDVLTSKDFNALYTKSEL